MRGLLDEVNRALLTIDCGLGPIDFVIDTGFDGSLIVGDELFEPTDACRQVGHVIADLAAEQVFAYEAWLVQFNWMGEDTQTRVLVGPGTDCLIGTALLEPHRLEIDYEKRTVELIRGSTW